MMGVVAGVDDDIPYVLEGVGRRRRGSGEEEGGGGGGGRWRREGEEGGPHAEG